MQPTLEALSYAGAEGTGGKSGVTLRNHPCCEVGNEVQAL